jgi:hypothetical protein
MNNTGLYTKLGERLNSFPESRCTLVSDCIKFVTPGSNNVFLDVTQQIFKARQTFHTIILYSHRSITWMPSDKILQRLENAICK